MAVGNQKITKDYAIYNGDCCEVVKDLKTDSVDLSVYSPPFSGLYNYSSSEHDMSNCRDDQEFLTHYGFLINDLARVTKPGRLTVVHCADVSKPGQTLYDLPGEIIRLHAARGFDYVARYAIWKEPLAVAIRTRALGLTHRQIVKDSSLCTNAGADFILAFRRRGTNKVPIAHPTGFKTYAGERQPPDGFWEKFKNWEDPQTNKLAHWIWQQYASSIWDDIRVGRVLPYKPARDKDDEKHVHPLQLDVIERCIIMWSNPQDVVLTPFMGVGSECYGALSLGRRAIGIELKESYFKQAIRNLEEVKMVGEADDQTFLEFGELDNEAA
jgi:DNA modification methylase